MAIQFFGKVISDGISDENLEIQVNKALDKCIAILRQTQQEDGSWNTRGWAPVLNSAMANNALEVSQNIGKDVDYTLDKSRDYQKTNVNASSGKAKIDRAAGIELYALTSSKRATAKEAKEANLYFAEKQEQNQEIELPQSEEEAFDLLRDDFSDSKARKLASAYNVNEKVKKQVTSDAVISGFGNKGGEEYLSYMMTSESFITEQDEESWKLWHEKMSSLFEKVQNGNGSWAGQHCITSPVRDAGILLAEKN